MSPKAARPLGVPSARQPVKALGCPHIVPRAAWPWCVPNLSRPQSSPTTARPWGVPMSGLWLSPCQPCAVPMSALVPPSRAQPWHTQAAPTPATRSGLWPRSPPDPGPPPLPPGPPAPLSLTHAGRSPQCPRPQQGVPADAVPVPGPQQLGDGRGVPAVQQVQQGQRRHPQHHVGRRLQPRHGRGSRREEGTGDPGAGGRRGPRALGRPAEESPRRPVARGGQGGPRVPGPGSRGTVGTPPLMALPAELLRPGGGRSLRDQKGAGPPLASRRPSRRGGPRSCRRYNGPSATFAFSRPAPTLRRVAERPRAKVRLLLTSHPPS